MSVHVETKSGGYSRTLPELTAADRLLPAVWRLVAPGPNGVAEDVEAIVVGAVAEVFRRHPTIAETLGRDDAVEHLLSEVWLLFTKYDETKRSGSGSFAGYLYDRLRFRLVDYWRKQFGRHGEKLAAAFKDEPELDFLRIASVQAVEDEPWQHAVPLEISRDARAALNEVGELLLDGFTYREIADRLTPRRSEDYVAGRVALLKRELGHLLEKAA